MTREGSLEAPTRHPIDWKNPEYWEEPKIFAEMERIFDICHGCRRCVSLCNTFPTLFDYVDETPSGEVHDVPKEVYWNVVDQCYLCDLCYMVKCPYVPPHPWNVDFPHLMLRAKAYQFREGKLKHPFRDRMLSSTDRNGKLATIPVVVRAVNAGSKSKPLRALGEKRCTWTRTPGCRSSRRARFAAMRNRARRTRCATASARPARSRCTPRAT